MKLSPRSRRWLIGALAGLALFAVLGFFVAPPVIKSQAQKRAAALLGRDITIGRVKLNPFALSLTIENLDLREKNPATSFTGWTRLYVNFDALASLGGEWVLADVELDGFHAAVAINADRSYNFSDLLARFAPPPAAPGAAVPPPAGSSRPLRVGRLAVTQARVDFTDHSLRQPFASTMGPLTFTLTDFRTAGDSGAPYRFEAATEAGEKLSWQGSLAADPPASRGEFSVEGLVLRKYAPYIETQFGGDLLDGRLSVRGRYEASFAAGKPVLKLDRGEVQLRELRIAERGSTQPVVELRAFDVTDLHVDAAALKATVGRIAVTGGRAAASRDADGAINLLRLLPANPPVAPAPANPAPTAPAPAAPGPAAMPDVKIGEIAITDFGLEFADQAAPRPAKLALSAVKLSLRDVTLADGASVPLELSFNWAPQGTVRVAGSLKLRPELSADLRTEVADLGLLPLSPYLEQFANARLTGGAISTTHTVQLSLPAAGPPGVRFAGDVTLAGFGLVDGVNNEELAGVSRLALTGIEAATAPQLAVSVKEIAVAGPYARAVVNADQSLNLALVAKAAPAPAAPAAPAEPAAAAATPAERPRIEVGRVVISDGNFSFTDRSVKPEVRTALTGFGGSIDGLSSVNPARADLDLKGTVDGSGLVAIGGKLDPLGSRMFVDLKMDFRNVDLLPLSPYTGKYAGYELARGQLVVDTKILLDGGKVDAANVVTLNQFTFGSATNSPDATSLPVRLGVALLKDTDGRIVIDLPVQGNLDDPEFKIGRVVLRVVTNLLTKAAVSPFALLGSMFGGGGDELAFQEFRAGDAELQPTERPKLETMVKALTNRPGLSLALEGSYDAAADTYELKRRKLADTVRRRIWEQRRATTPDIPPPEQLEIPAEEHAAMVRRLFEEKFPPGTEFGGPLPPPPLVTAPPPPRRGVFQRIVATLTGEERRARQAIEKENARRAAEHEKAVAAVSAAGVPFEEMLGRLAESTEVTDDDLRALAAARARSVRDYLAGIGQISNDRLFLVQGQDGAKQPKGPRVFLSLQ